MESPRAPDAGGERSRSESSAPQQALPGLTHLQFLVLDVLCGCPSGTSATTLREVLSEYGEDREGPKFYQMMRRLQEAGLVESWSQPFDVGGGKVTRTCYRVTGPGRVALELTLEFYAVRIRASQRLCDPGASRSGGGDEGGKR